jgi:hypothetical protein
MTWWRLVGRSSGTAFSPPARQVCIRFERWIDMR